MRKDLWYLLKLTTSKEDTAVKINADIVLGNMERKKAVLQIRKKNSAHGIAERN
ncbi:MAG TPA: hypothetical protein VNZ46_26195 [Pedobacter sp.]|nr:hypothetical protein [Pedobacter sp.]